MADKLVTLQDENKTPIYPESRASVVKTSDGTTVEDALAEKQPSGNYATKEELKTKADVISSEDGGSGTVKKELHPNRYYKFGECVSLTVTLAAEIEGVFNEYSFEFTSGATATTLSIPEAIKWSGGNAPTIEANKTYQVSIVNNLAVYAAF